MNKIITLEQLIQIIGEIPSCKCPNCKENNIKVNVKPNKNGSYSRYLRTGYPNFLSGHNKTGIFNPNYKPEIHSRTIEDMIHDIGEIPYCQCKDLNGNNCGLKINIDIKYYNDYKKHGYPKFIKVHIRRGIPHKPETKKKQSDAKKEYFRLHPEAKMIGYKNGMFGKKQSDNFKINLIKRNKNNNPMKRPEVVAKISGENSSTWIDGRSKLPYCEKWTYQFRESIRFRDSYICQLCGITQSELTKYFKQLSVHHIHYLKSDCYPDCITLCQSCNSKVNKKSDRKNFESLFMNKLNERGLLLWSKRNMK